jgi:hypothetical protein
VDPAVERGEPFGVGQPRLGVGELLEQGPVEPLGLPVRPGTVRSGEPASDLEFGAGPGPLPPNCCCLALAERVGGAAVTADTAWAQLPLDDLALTVRLIR